VAQKLTPDPLEQPEADGFQELYDLFAPLGEALTEGPRREEEEEEEEGPKASIEYGVVRSWDPETQQWQEERGEDDPDDDDGILDRLTKAAGVVMPVEAREVTRAPAEGYGEHLRGFEAEVDRDDEVGHFTKSYYKELREEAEALRQEETRETYEDYEGQKKLLQLDDEGEGLIEARAQRLARKRLAAVDRRIEKRRQNLRYAQQYGGLPGMLEGGDQPDEELRRLQRLRGEVLQKSRSDARLAIAKDLTLTGTTAAAFQQEDSAQFNRYLKEKLPFVSQGLLANERATGEEDPTIAAMREAWLEQRLEDRAREREQATTIEADRAPEGGPSAFDIAFGNRGLSYMGGKAVLDPAQEQRRGWAKTRAADNTAEVERRRSRWASMEPRFLHWLKKQDPQRQAVEIAKRKRSGHWTPLLEKGWTGWLRAQEPQKQADFHSAAMAESLPRPEAAEAAADEAAAGTMAGAILSPGTEGLMTVSQWLEDDVMAPLYAAGFMSTPSEYEAYNFERGWQPGDDAEALKTWGPRALFSLVSAGSMLNRLSDVGLDAYEYKRLADIRKGIVEAGGYWMDPDKEGAAGPLEKSLLGDYHYDPTSKLPLGDISVSKTARTSAHEAPARYLAALVGNIAQDYHLEQVPVPLPGRIVDGELETWEGKVWVPVKNDTPIPDLDWQMALNKYGAIAFMQEFAAKHEEAHKGLDDQLNAWVKEDRNLIGAVGRNMAESYTGLWDIAMTRLALKRTPEEIGMLEAGASPYEAAFAAGEQEWARMAMGTTAFFEMFAARPWDVATEMPWDTAMMVMPYVPVLRRKISKAKKRLGLGTGESQPAGTVGPAPLAEAKRLNRMEKALNTVVQTHASWVRHVVASGKMTFNQTRAYLGALFNDSARQFEGLAQSMLSDGMRSSKQMYSAVAGAAERAIQSGDWDTVAGREFVDVGPGAPAQPTPPTPRRAPEAPEPPPPSPPELEGVDWSPADAPDTLARERVREAQLRGESAWEPELLKTAADRRADRVRETYARGESVWEPELLESPYDRFRQSQEALGAQLIEVEAKADRLAQLLREVQGNPELAPQVEAALRETLSDKIDLHREMEYARWDYERQTTAPPRDVVEPTPAPEQPAPTPGDVTGTMDFTRPETADITRFESVTFTPEQQRLSALKAELRDVHREEGLLAQQLTEAEKQGQRAQYQRLDQEHNDKTIRMYELLEEIRVLEAQVKAADQRSQAPVSRETSFDAARNDTQARIEAARQAGDSVREEVFTSALELLEQRRTEGWETPTQQAATPPTPEAQAPITEQYRTTRTQLEAKRKELAEVEKQLEITEAQEGDYAQFGRQEARRRREAQLQQLQDAWPQMDDFTRRRARPLMDELQRRIEQSRATETQLRAELQAEGVSPEQRVREAAAFDEQREYAFEGQRSQLEGDLERARARGAEAEAAAISQGLLELQRRWDEGWETPSARGNVRQLPGARRPAPRDVEAAYAALEPEDIRMLREKQARLQDEIGQLEDRRLSIEEQAAHLFDDENPLTPTPESQSTVPWEFGSNWRQITHGMPADMTATLERGSFRHGGINALGDDIVQSQGSQVRQALVYRHSTLERYLETIPEANTKLHEEVKKDLGRALEDIHSWDARIRGDVKVGFEGIRSGPADTLTLNDLPKAESELAAAQQAWGRVESLRGAKGRRLEEIKAEVAILKMGREYVRGPDGEVLTKNVFTHKGTQPGEPPRQVTVKEQRSIDPERAQQKLYELEAEREHLTQEWLPTQSGRKGKFSEYDPTQPRRGWEQRRTTDWDSVWTVDEQRSREHLATTPGELRQVVDQAKAHWTDVVHSLRRRARFQDAEKAVLRAGESWTPAGAISRGRALERAVQGEIPQFTQSGLLRGRLGLDDLEGYPHYGAANQNIIGDTMRLSDADIQEIIPPPLPEPPKPKPPSRPKPPAKYVPPKPKDLMDQAAEFYDTRDYASAADVRLRDSLRRRWEAEQRQRFGEPPPPSEGFTQLDALKTRGREAAAAGDQETAAKLRKDWLTLAQKQDADTVAQVRRHNRFEFEIEKAAKAIDDPDVAWSEKSNWETRLWDLMSQRADFKGYALPDTPRPPKPKAKAKPKATVVPEAPKKPAPPPPPPPQSPAEAVRRAERERVEMRQQVELSFDVATGAFGQTRRMDPVHVVPQEARWGKTTEKLFQDLNKVYDDPEAKALYAAAGDPDARALYADKAQVGSALQNAFEEALDYTRPAALGSQKLRKKVIDDVWSEVTHHYAAQGQGGPPGLNKRDFYQNLNAVLDESSRPLNSTDAHSVQGRRVVIKLRDENGNVARTIDVHGELVEAALSKSETLRKQVQAEAMGVMGQRVAKRSMERYRAERLMEERKFLEPPAEVMALPREAHADFMADRIVEMAYAPNEGSLPGALHLGDVTLNGLVDAITRKAKREGIDDVHLRNIKARLTDPSFGYVRLAELDSSGNLKKQGAAWGTESGELVNYAAQQTGLPESALTDIWVPRQVVEHWKWSYRALHAVQDQNLFRTIIRAVKANLTARSLPTLMNNVLANFSMQLLRRDEILQPFQLAADAVEWKAYRFNEHALRINDLAKALGERPTEAPGKIGAPDTSFGGRARALLNEARRVLREPLNEATRRPTRWKGKDPGVERTAFSRDPRKMATADIVAELDYLTERQKMWDAIERTGVVDTTQIEGELGALKRGGLLDKLTGYQHSMAHKIIEAQESWYRGSENIFKINETVYRYNEAKQLTQKVQPGDYIKLRVSPSEVVRLRRYKDGSGWMLERANKSVRLGNDSPQLHDIWARVGEFEAQQMFFDYTDLPRFGLMVRALPGVDAASPFFSWFWKALYIPGMKDGLPNTIYRQGIWAESNSAPVQKALLRRTVKGSMRRAAMHSALAGWMATEYGYNDMLEALSHLPSERAVGVLQYMFPSGLFRQWDFTHLYFGSPTDVGMRLTERALNWIQAGSGLGETPTPGWGAATTPLGIPHSVVGALDPDELAKAVREGKFDTEVLWPKFEASNPVVIAGQRAVDILRQGRAGQSDAEWSQLQLEAMYADRVGQPNFDLVGLGLSPEQKEEIRQNRRLAADARMGRLGGGGDLFEMIGWGRSPLRTLWAKSDDEENLMAQGRGRGTTWEQFARELGPMTFGKNHWRLLEGVVTFADAAGAISAEDAAYSAYSYEGYRDPNTTERMAPHWFTLGRLAGKMPQRVATSKKSEALDKHVQRMGNYWNKSYIQPLKHLQSTVNDRRNGAKTRHWKARNAVSQARFDEPYYDRLGPEAKREVDMHPSVTEVWGEYKLHDAQWNRLDSEIKYEESIKSHHMAKIKQQLQASAKVMRDLYEFRRTRGKRWWRRAQGRRWFASGEPVRGTPQISPVEPADADRPVKLFFDPAHRPGRNIDIDRYADPEFDPDTAYTGQLSPRGAKRKAMDQYFTQPENLWMPMYAKRGDHVPYDTTAHVTRVLDGDTFEVLIDGRPERVRLGMIDTPESSMAGGQEATDFARSLIEGKQVTLTNLRRDTYGRLLASHANVDGVDLGTRLIESGMAWAYKNEGPQWAAQQEAQMEQQGLWSADLVQDPGVYRKDQKTRKRAARIYGDIQATQQKIRDLQKMYEELSK
jgi:endonuclease YncB( thermonuclease family)